MMKKIYQDLKTNIHALYNNNNIITVVKFLHHSFKYPEMQSLFSKYKGDYKKIEKELFDHINQYEMQPNQDLGFTELIDQIDSQLKFQIQNRIRQNSKHVFEEEIVQYLMKLAMNFEANKLSRQMQETGSVAHPHDISIESFLHAVIDLSSRHQEYAAVYKMIKESGFNIEKFIKDDNLGKSNNKSLIKELCVNLNERARNGKIQTVIGRDREIDQLVNILKKARKNNPVLVGKAGVGKTAIVEGLAKRIEDGDVPKALKGAVIYELQVMNMVKGTSFRGQFEQKMSDLLEEFKELEASGQLPILFIDELHTIMGAGSSGQGGLDFSNIIKPALARGELRTIGATTTDEWYRFIKENPALDRRFIGVTIKEPNIEDACHIINNSLSFYEKAHGVKYDTSVVERAVELSVQFITDNALPDKAFDLIDYSGAMNAVKHKKLVTMDDVEEALARHKNIDLNAIVGSRQHDIKPIAPRLKEVIFGQDEAVEKVAKVAQKAIAGLNAKDKPYGSFLFTGPTGTGKTELAKQLANVMNANFHRLDMSEFREPHSVAKLIGAPAGYVGYEDGSSLTKVINEHPRTVLLLDEIEKAHKDVWKLFLQVMDYGKLTDSKGREINFRNVVLIMTSNAGVKTAEALRGSIGLNSLAPKSTTVDHSEVNKVFSPEFRARLTGNADIEFHALSEEILEQIVHKYISEVQKDRLDKKNIRLVLSPAVTKKIAQQGLSKNLGARPVKEYIESFVVEPLVDQILFGDLKNLKEMTEILVELEKNGEEDQIVISKAKED